MKRYFAGNKQSLRTKPFEKGLSMVEMVIVVMIISILAAISIVTFGNSAAVKADTQRKNDLAVIQNALQKYFANTLYYPSTLNFGGTLYDGVQTYNIPADPKSGWLQYCYAPTTPEGATTPQKYTLNARLQRPAPDVDTSYCGTPPEGYNYQVKYP